jgi:hypothetical protein
MRHAMGKVVDSLSVPPRTPGRRVVLNDERDQTRKPQDGWDLLACIKEQTANIQQAIDDIRQRTADINQEITALGHRGSFALVVLEGILEGVLAGLLILLLGYGIFSILRNFGMSSTWTLPSIWFVELVLFLLLVVKIETAQ